MRDKEYELAAPEGVYRFALVGSSHVMGYGVNDDQTFDAHLEKRLNDAAGPGAPVYEVLNFGVDGYRPLQELRQLETKVLKFAPDAVLYVAHNGAAYRSVQHLAEMLAAGVPIPYPELQEIVARAGAARGLTAAELERRLLPFGTDILSWAYRRMVALCREGGSVPVWVYLPTAGERISEETLAAFARIAADAGFDTLSLADAFRTHDPRRIWLSEWDHHPNALGHRLIGEYFYQQLIEGADGAAHRAVATVNAM
jgi:hypothetical protein